MKNTYWQKKRWHSLYNLVEVTITKWWFGYEAIFCKTYLDMINQYFSNLSLNLSLKFEVLSLELKITLYTNLDVFLSNIFSALSLCHNQAFDGKLCLWYICLIFSILKIVLNLAFDKTYERFYSSVCLWGIEIFHRNGDT